MDLIQLSSSGVLSKGGDGSQGREEATVNSTPASPDALIYSDCPPFPASLGRGSSRDASRGPSVIRVRASESRLGFRQTKKWMAFLKLEKGSFLVPQVGFTCGASFHRGHREHASLLCLPFFRAVSKLASSPTVLFFRYYIFFCLLVQTKMFLFVLLCFACFVRSLLILLKRLWMGIGFGFLNLCIMIFIVHLIWVLRSE